MQRQSLLCLFSNIVLSALAALLLASAALPMRAQNAVPLTARQAATMPQVAARLTHPASPASRLNPALVRQASRRGSGGANELYDNGPRNGTTDAWTINFGFATSNTFTVSSAGNPVQGMSFGAWLEPGDVLQTVEVQITSSEFGGTTYFDGVLSFTASGCTGNQYGFNVCTETANFSGPTLQPGTYWVNLDNAVVNTGDPVYWDENSGIGCDSPGCPSEASENTVGTIPSEAFTILGMNTCFGSMQETPAPEAKAVTVPRSPTQTYRVIYNFTGAGDGGGPATSLVIDAAGNLYGTTSGGGPAGGGTAFKLSPGASGWLFSRLYSFPSGNGSADAIILDANGALIGTTGGGAQGDGALFELSPPGHILPSIFSNWMETVLYSFTGGNDGANPGGSLVLDSFGNIYGTAARGGANHNGTLYEFTNGGIQVLHSFPGMPNDGLGPIGVVNGSGGLYGITTGGGLFGTGTLYTAAGGYQVLHSFGPYQINGGPTSLAADSVGNLYSGDTFHNCFADGTTISQFSPPDFVQTILTNIDIGDGPLTSWVSTDILGNVYGTIEMGGQSQQGNAFQLTCCWNYTDLHDFSGGPNDGSNPAAAPVVDAQGNIYGTTQLGGAYGFGVVWEISP